MAAIWHMLIGCRLRRWAVRHPEAAEKVERFFFWVFICLICIAVGGVIIGYALR